MKYIDLNSKKGFVNLFADYVLKHFNSDTIIEVSNCGPFFVVRGETTKRELVDLNPIKEMFLKEYPNFKIENVNIIDIINYNIEIEKKAKWFKYYNTQRPVYPKTQIEKIEDSKDNDKFDYSSLTVTSQFPHGYGLDVGRFDYYFGEYVSNHIFNITNADSIELKYDNEYVVEDMILTISLENSLLSRDYVKSLLFDVFYTKDNIFEIRSLIESYDLILDLTNPLSDKPWLIKNKIEDVVVF